MDIEAIFPAPRLSLADGPLPMISADDSGKIDLSRNRLTELLPGAIPDSVTWLDISHNQLTEAQELSAMERVRRN